MRKSTKTRLKESDELDPTWLCKACGKQYKTARGYDIHMSAHARRAANAYEDVDATEYVTKLPNASELPLARAAEALSLITDKGEQLLASLYAQRGEVVAKIAGLNAEVAAIDRRMRQLNVILTMNSVPMPDEVTLQDEDYAHKQLVDEDYDRELQET